MPREPVQGLKGREHAVRLPLITDGHQPRNAAARPGDALIVRVVPLRAGHATGCSW